MFKGVGSAPELKVKKFKLASSATVQNILDFLRKQLQYKPEEPLFIFINSAFQPSPDEVIGSLYKVIFQNSLFLIIFFSVFKIMEN